MSWSKDLREQGASAVFDNEVPPYDAPDFIELHDIPPQIVEADGSKTWVMRGQNFAMTYTEAKRGARLERRNHESEYMVVLPEAIRPEDPQADADIVANADSVRAPSASLSIVPPGDSAVTMLDDGIVVRIFGPDAADLLKLAANAGKLRNPACPGCAARNRCLSRRADMLCVAIPSPSILLSGTPRGSPSGPAQKTLATADISSRPISWCTFRRGWRRAMSAAPSRTAHQITSMPPCNLWAAGSIMSARPGFLIRISGAMTFIIICRARASSSFHPGSSIPPNRFRRFPVRSASTARPARAFRSRTG
jgi:hypothetical protein